MCGLFFVAQFGAPVSRARFEAAFATMKHRGPDATVHRYGSVAIERAGGPATLHWAAGHHRLAILDLDPRSLQPFGDDRRFLLYNGEAYDYERLRGHSALSAHDYTTTGDTEVLFAGIGTAGERFLDDVNGMWALLFADLPAGRIDLCRDRFGKKPLFWRMDDDTLCVASTFAAIDRYLERPTRFDALAMAAFVSQGSAFPGAALATHHADILQVPPSTAVSIDLAAWSATSRSYFSVDSSAATKDDDELAATLGDAFRLRLVSDRPVGVLLSGGIDSSLLLSIAHAENLLDQVHCFIGDTGMTEDADYARRCATELNVAVKTVPANYADMPFARFLDICRNQEKPFPLFGNSMAMPMMYEAIAAEGVPVVLDGTGGDEIFGGYWDRYFPFAAREAWARKDVRWLIDVATADPSRVEQIKAAIDPPPAKAPSKLLSQLARFDVEMLSLNDPLAAGDLSFNEALAIDAVRGRLGDWLWQNDRNAMMFSIENRSPLLDFRLAGHLASGYATKFSGAWNKLQLRKAFDAFTRLPTQWRTHKQGFGGDRKRFMENNRASVIELIASSEIVDHLIDRQRFVNSLRRHETTLHSTVAVRLLSIAGVHEAMSAST